MVNERPCTCHHPVVCYACFQAAKAHKRIVPADDSAVPRWLASPFTIHRQLTSRQVDHRRRMHAHLAAQG